MNVKIVSAGWALLFVAPLLFGQFGRRSLPGNPLAGITAEEFERWPPRVRRLCRGGVRMFESEFQIGNSAFNGVERLAIVDTVTRPSEGSVLVRTRFARYFRRSRQGLRLQELMSCRPSDATCFRFAEEGIRGGRLEGISIGRRQNTAYTGSAGIPRVAWPLFG